MVKVAAMALEERLGNVLQRTCTKVGPEAARQLHALIEPESLAILAGVLVAWVLGHAFGVGEAIDIVIGFAGLFSIGMAVFSGLDELFEFARDTYRAKTENDLDRAARHLAQAIAILGVQSVLALLFKNRPKVRRFPVGLPPRPPLPGAWRDTPTITWDPSLRAGYGETSSWGDIIVSSQGAADDRAIVLLHERLHQILTPKFYLLRRFRVENKIGSYLNSSLYRCVEEALAETVAQVGVTGMQKLFVGIRFPVEEGYVFVMKGGGFDEEMRGRGLLPEGAGLLASGAVQGFAFSIWFSRSAPARGLPTQPRAAAGGSRGTANASP